MAWFPDLSPYAYSAFALPGTVNIGWLNPVHPFPVGPIQEPFRAQLRTMHELALVNKTRGPHLCEFCPHDGFIECGSAELHIEGVDGRVYAAPSLILHYVCRHSYRPPDEFVAAVLCGVSVQPEPSDLDEVLARTLVYRARSLLWREPTKAASKLQVVVSKYPGSSVAVEARELLAAVQQEICSRG